MQKERIIISFIWKQTEVGNEKTEGTHLTIN
jgi:hypothetical protein